MRVGFLRAYDPEVPYQWALPPLGIGYLAAYAKRERPGHEFFFEKEFGRLVERKPDLLAISSASENFGQAAEFARRAKEALGIPVIAGGMHVTSLPHKLPGVFDTGCVGEGEAAFVELLDLFSVRRHPGPGDYAKIRGICWHEGEGVAVNEPRPQFESLDVLPHPDRGLLGEDWAVPFSKEIHLVSSRGCPYHCAFCSSGRHWRTYRSFSAEYTVREIETLRERYNSERFFFFDDLFIVNSQRFNRICQLLKERRLLEGARFRCYGRVDLITEPMADLLAEHNFHWVDFGFESNDAQVLKFLNKTRASPEVNQRCVDLLARRKISIGGSLIVGCPGEDGPAIQRTLDFVTRNEPFLDRLGFGLLQPLPGTAVWDYALQRGLVSEDMDWGVLATTSQGFDIERFPYLGDRLSRQEIVGWMEKFERVAERINLAGQVRELERKTNLQTEEIRRLQSVVDSYGGSRIVQAALKIRALRRRLGWGATPVSPPGRGGGGEPLS